MEFIFEFIFGFMVELVFENKVPKYIRYPLLVIISLFFLYVIGVFIFEGIILLRDNMLRGWFFIFVGLFLFIMSIIVLKKKFNKRN